MRKHAYYLDTNVISHLADSERTDHKVHQRLALLVRSGVIEVFGATEFIEEFAGMAGSKPEHFARTLELFWTLIGDKVLIGQDKLLVKEIGNRHRAAQR